MLLGSYSYTISIIELMLLGILPKESLVRMIFAFICPVRDSTTFLSVCQLTVLSRILSRIADLQFPSFFDPYKYQLYIFRQKKIKKACLLRLISNPLGSSINLQFNHFTVTVAEDNKID